MPRERRTLLERVTPIRPGPLREVPRYVLEEVRRSAWPALVILLDGTTELYPGRGLLDHFDHVHIAARI